ncbi:unnamed protein product, partial [Phaeothamnion confervicola]
WTENDFRRRKAAPGYLEHRRIEDVVVGMNRPGLDTCVIAAGVPYGRGEGVLAPLFQRAWQYPSMPLELPCHFGEETRALPALVHVADLCGMVTAIIGTGSSPKRYMLCLED